MARRLLLLVFVLSGATSLVYQTLWIRVLSLGVGSTSASMSLVLAIFFIGLSGGSYLAGRYVNDWRNPLRVYALIEAGVGLYGLFILYPLFQLHKVLALIPNLASLSAVGFFAKLVLVSLFLAAPTLGMGATLPILVKVFLRRDASVGRNTSLLYGINTLGAVLGAVATGFFLIPRLGIVRANQLAALINVAIGVAAFLLARASEVRAADTAPVPVTSRILDIADRRVLSACAVCGFVSISSEVIWNKYLGIFFGTNIYGLGLVLGLYLVGIALGSLALATRIDRVTDKRRLFVRLYAVSLVLVLATSRLFNFAPPVANFLYGWLAGRVSLLVVKSLVTAAILFLPTCVFGALLPLGIATLGRDRESAPRLVGLAYALNTLGAIVGSYATGILLIPAMGSSHTLCLVSLVGILGGLLLVVQPRALHWAGAVAGAAFAIFGGSLDFRNILKAGYHQSTPLTKANPVRALLAPVAQDEQYRLIIEGETAIISLSHDPKDGPEFRNYLRLKTNGLNESVYDRLRPAMLPRYEALIALLPYALAKNPARAFVVGYGGGYTVDFLTSTPLARVDVVELEKGILTAADFVHHGKNPLRALPNLNLQIEDARFVLATNGMGKHDIVISQPSHSWLTGAANLFTREFFEIVKGGLTGGGVFSQWLNLYNMDVDTLRTILRTFYAVFPHGAVFTNVGDQELVMIGSLQPLALDWARLSRIAEDETFRRKLAGVPIAAPSDLLSQFSLSREEVLHLAGAGVENTDVNAYAESHQSALFYRPDGESNSPQRFLSHAYSADFAALVPARERSPDLVYRIATALDEEGQYDKFHALIHRYEAGYDGADPLYAWRLGFLCLKAHRYESGLKYLRHAYAKLGHVDIANNMLSALIDTGRNAEALLLARGIPARRRNQVTDCYQSHALLQTAGAHRPDTRALFGKLVANVPGYSAACGEYYNKLVGLYYHARGNLGVALPFFEAYANAYIHDTDVLERMVASYRATGDAAKAERFEGYLAETRKQEQSYLKELASYYRARHLDDDAAVLEASAARKRMAE